MRYRFSGCELDTEAGVFLRDGKIIDLEPQVFALIRLLASRAGRLVTRDDLVEHVWRGRIVSESTISSRIAAVRRAIGDDDRDARVLTTLPKRGFRLDDVESSDRHAAETELAPPPQQSVNYAKSGDGTAIAWATTGHGPPLLRAGQFLTHLELDWQSRIRRPLLERFDAAFSQTRFDQRGTGLSETPRDGFGLDRLVEDMEAVVDAAGLARFPIWASSQGVPISLAFAAKHPHRVTRLVLYGGFVTGRLRRDVASARQTRALLGLISEGWGAPEGAFAKAYTTLYMPDASSAQIEDICRLQLASATPGAAARLRRAIDAIDVSHIAPRVRAPALLLHAAGDCVNPISQSEALAALMPAARLISLPGRDHVPLPGSPAWQRLVAESLEFLAAT